MPTTSNGVKQTEEQLAAEIAKIQALAKENKNLDATALISRLLEQHQTSSVTSKERMKAYLISMLFPPFGLYFVLKYIFREEPDARRLGVVSLLLTIGSIVFAWALLNIILSPFAGQLEQVQNIDLKQIQELIR